MDQLYLIFSNRKTFPRRRFDPYVKAISIKAYVKGLSLRGVSNFLKEIGYKISREAIRKWFLKAGEIISNNKIKKKSYLWAAREVKSGEIIALHLRKSKRSLY